VAWFRVAGRLGFRSGLVFFGLRLHVPRAPSSVTSTPFQGLYLSKKLCGERRFAPETFVAGFASQAQLHVTNSCLKRTPNYGQLLFFDFKQHSDNYWVAKRAQNGALVDIPDVSEELQTLWLQS
jgi:hypothetical protein